MWACEREGQGKGERERARRRDTQTHGGECRQRQGKPLPAGLELRGRILVPADLFSYAQMFSPQGLDFPIYKVGMIIVFIGYCYVTHQPQIEWLEALNCCFPRM